LLCFHFNYFILQLIIFQVDLPTSEHETITSVVAGLEHSLVLTDAGAVYACGLGADMQLGECYLFV
jgi:alpha-tubulin suppressor-like RCC1 family protein